MVHAYIMIRTGPGASRDIISSVRNSPAVTEAHVVAGEHDIIAEVEVDSVYEVLQTASDELQGIDGIIETRSYIALD